MWLTLAASVIAAQGTAPTPEALALGVELARTTGIATIAPTLVEKDLSELASEDKTLTPNERDRLLAIGRARGRDGLEKVVQAIGSAYARRMTVPDLRLLVAHANTDAARRLRAAQPMVIAEAAAALGSIDLKAQVAADFCRETRKLCSR